MAEKQTNAQLKKQETPMSVRFMNKAIAEFGSSVGKIALTNFQKRLAQNYFIVADAALKAAEERRMKKSEKYRDPTPVTWANVDLEELAKSVVSAARIGWDPLQDNHVSLIPFKDNNIGKYKINFMPGYRGLELKAIKYGLDVPDYVVVELVHKNDHFKEIKKDRNNPIETYEFEITNSFDRGEIVGGFYYHGWKDKPEKNKLVVFTLEDILKRKPEYAAPEFWGGEKDEYKNGQKTGNKIKVEGWFKEMCWKTIYRAAYKNITIDSQKIDDDYLRLKQMEDSFAESEVAREIAENANKEAIDVEYDVVDKKAFESEPGLEPEPEEVIEEPAAEKGPVTAGVVQQTLGGPGF
jgi:recombination protein RecT